MSMEHELNEALDASINGEKPDKRVMVRSLTDKNIDNIESVIGQLRANLATIEEQIAERQDRHRQTKRAIAAFEMALKMLSS